MRGAVQNLIVVPIRSNTTYIEGRRYFTLGAMILNESDFSICYHSKIEQRAHEHAYKQTHLLFFACNYLKTCACRAQCCRPQKSSLKQPQVTHTCLKGSLFALHIKINTNLQHRRHYQQQQQHRRHPRNHIDVHADVHRHTRVYTHARTRTHVLEVQVF